MANKKVLILHGWGGSDFPHWQSYLAMDLIQNNYTVSFPQLPNIFQPNLLDWLKYLKTEMEHFQPDIVVCHSLANILWFHYLVKYDIKPIEKLMLVSPVSPKCDISEISTFFPYNVPNDLKANKHIIVSSDNDPYISVDELFNLKDILGTSLKIIENGGHLNSESGYGKLKCAYDWIIS